MDVCSDSSGSPEVRKQTLRVKEAKGNETHIWCSAARPPLPPPHPMVSG